MVVVMRPLTALMLVVVWCVLYITTGSRSHPALLSKGKYSLEQAHSISLYRGWIAFSPDHTSLLFFCLFGPYSPRLRTSTAQSQKCCFTAETRFHRPKSRLPTNAAGRTLNQILARTTWWPSPPAAAPSLPRDRLLPAPTQGAARPPLSQNPAQDFFSHPTSASRHQSQQIPPSGSAPPIKKIFSPLRPHHLPCGLPFFVLFPFDTWASLSSRRVLLSSDDSFSGCHC